MTSLRRLVSRVLGSGMVVLLLAALGLIAVVSAPLVIPIQGATIKHHQIRLPPPAVISGAGSAESNCQTTQTGCALALLHLMNEERSRVSAPPLALSWFLAKQTASCIAAFGHARHLAAVVTSYGVFGQFAHDQFPHDLCGSYSRAGQNVGVATGSKFAALTAIHNGMMSEPHDSVTCASVDNHACNILNRGYTRVGIGFAQNALGWFVVEDFEG